MDAGRDNFRLKNNVKCFMFEGYEKAMEQKLNKKIN